MKLYCNQNAILFSILLLAYFMPSLSNMEIFVSSLQITRTHSFFVWLTCMLVQFNLFNFFLLMKMFFLLVKLQKKKLKLFLLSYKSNFVLFPNYKIKYFRNLYYEYDRYLPNLTENNLSVFIK